MSLDKLHVPPGHYYSPIPSLSDFKFADNFRNKRNLSGVDLFPKEQLKLAHHFAAIYPETIEWLKNKTTKFSLDNSWFFGSDAITLSLIILHTKPKKIIEIGSGYSTALLEDLRDFWFDGELVIDTVDPNQERTKLLNLNVVMHECAVQEIVPSFFSTLEAGDCLLIDSSHVLKAGSDVHYLLNEVFTKLKSGVKVHIHDIFYPFEYPSSWFEKNVAFNEAYAIELLLKNSNKLRVFYWNDFLENTYPDWFQRNMPECLNGPHKTGGIWLEIL